MIDEYRTNFAIKCVKEKIAKLFIFRQSLIILMLIAKKKKKIDFKLFIIFTLGRINSIVNSIIINTKSICFKF